MLVTFPRVFDGLQCEQNFTGIINVRVKLIVELEVPTTWFNVFDFLRPVPFVTYFL